MKSYFAESSKNQENIRTMKDYIESPEEIVTALKDEGKGVADIKNVQMPERYKDWWLADYFQTNLKFVFNEIMTN
jgi:hypothetical protein